MFADWSPWSRRIIAVGLLGVLVMLGVNGVILPVVGAFARQSEQISGLEDHYARFARVALEKPGLEARFKAMAADQAWRGRLVSGATVPDAGTDLQQRIRSAAGAADIELQSFEPLQPTPENGFTRLGVRIEIQGTSDRLAMFLETLHNDPALLLFDNVSLRSQGGGAGARLQARFEVYGFWASKEHGA